MLALQTGSVQVPIWPRAAVHDTVAAIVKQAAYRRELNTTLLDRVMQWIQEALARLMESFRGVPHGRLVATVAAVIVGILIVARVVYAARLRAAVLEEGERRGGGGGGARGTRRETGRGPGPGGITPPPPTLPPRPAGHPPPRRPPLTHPLTNQMAPSPEI